MTVGTLSPYRKLDKTRNRTAQSHWSSTRSSISTSLVQRRSTTKMSNRLPGKSLQLNYCRPCVLLRLS
uniref:Uncharacterized protein n=1 Tax=Ditylenchus dipsaci TaxID=166011 RepID=A0A915EDN3_9BILA